MALHLATSRNLHHAILLCDDEEQTELITTTLEKHGITTTPSRTYLETDLDRDPENVSRFVTHWHGYSQCRTALSNYTLSTIPDLCRMLGNEVWSIGDSNLRKERFCSLFTRFGHDLTALSLNEVRKLQATVTHTSPTNLYPEPPKKSFLKSSHKAPPLNHRESIDQLSPEITKVISFSLFGDEPIYLQGILYNLKLVKSLYPDWHPLVYLDHTISPSLVTRIRALGATPILHQDLVIPTIAARFLPLSEHCFSHILVRDADSRLNPREVTAVSEWIASGKPFHTMKDNSAHRRPILAGLFGSHGGLFPDLHPMLRRFPWSRKYGEDEDFLEQEIWPVLKEKDLVHTHTTDSLTTTLPKGQYLGQRFDHHDRPVMKTGPLKSRTPKYKSRTSKRKTIPIK